MRTTSSDKNIILKPPRDMSLEIALEYIEDDELVEITPKTIRLRKRYLKENERKRFGRAMERRRKMRQRHQDPKYRDKLNMPPVNAMQSPGVLIGNSLARHWISQLLITAVTNYHEPKLTIPQPLSPRPRRRLPRSVRNVRLSAHDASPNG